MQLQLDKIQVDNQTGSPYPVVFGRHVVDKLQLYKAHKKLLRSTPSDKQMAAIANKPMLYFGITTLLGHKDTVIEYLNFLLQEIDFTIDADFLNLLFHYVTEMHKELRKHKTGTVEKFRNLLLKNRKASLDTDVTNVVVNWLNIQPIKINFRFEAVCPIRFPPAINIPHSLSLFMNAYAFLVDIRATFKIASFCVQHIGECPAQVLHLLEMFYTAQFSSEARRSGIMGLKLLAAKQRKSTTNLPNGAIQAKSVFYDPALGSTLGPNEFAGVLGHGGYKLVSQIIRGGLDPVAEILGGVSKLAARVTLDEHFQRRIRDPVRGPKLLKATKRVGQGLGGAITGVIKRPVYRFQAGKRKGTGHAVAGIFRGMYEGVVGVAVKPVVGVVGGATDLLKVSHGNQGVDSTQPVWQHAYSMIKCAIFSYEMHTHDSNFEAILLHHA